MEITSCGDLVCRQSTSRAAKNGHIACLKCAHENGFPWDPTTTFHAASDIECLKYAHEHGCPWDPKTMRTAIRGYKKCLQYAYEHGCPWHKGTTYCVAYPGGEHHVWCLQYAHEHGCPWSSETTFSIAYGGYRECLQYAYEHGCPWDQNTTNAAAVRGKIRCLKYIYENCGNVVTWENSGLEKNFDEFPEKIQKYIESVREEWKAGRNHPGKNIKG